MENIKNHRNHKNSKIETRRNFLNSVLRAGHTVGITWEAKKGETTACVSLKDYESKNKNTVAHIEKYKTIYCRNRKRFTNVNLETLIEVRADKKTYRFK